MFAESLSGASASRPTWGFTEVGVDADPPQAHQRAIVSAMPRVHATRSSIETRSLG
jgi:hypothetical protein